MTPNARTRRLAAQPIALDVPKRASVAPVDDLLDRLWQLMTSMRVVLFIILALAVLVLFGTVIVQAPPGTYDNAQAKADWIAQVRPKYGGWTTVLDATQLFTAFQSVWFKILMTALSVSLVACSVHRVRGLWRTAARPHVAVGDQFLAHAPHTETIIARRDREQAVSGIRAVLARHRYRVLVEDGGALHFYADRNRWAPLGSLFGHLSLLLIMAGAIVGTTFGYRDSSFVVSEGSTAAVATDNLSVKLVAFHDSYYADTGQPSDYASDVILYQGGTQVARQTVRVNQPLRYGDVSFYQSFFGPSAVMTVKDASSQTVFSGGVPLAWSTNDSNRSVGSFTVSDAKLTVWVIGSSGTDDPLIKPGQVRLEIYRSDGDGQPVATQTIDQGKAASISGLSFTFDRENTFTGLNVSRDPGAPLVWIGALLLFGGFTVVFLFPNRRLWGRIVSARGRSTIALAAIGRHDTGVSSEFTSLVTDLRQALQTPASS